MPETEHNLPFGAVSLDPLHIPIPATLLQAVQAYLAAERRYEGAVAIHRPRPELVALGDAVDEARYDLDCAIERELRRQEAGA